MPNIALQFDPSTVPADNIPADQKAMEAVEELTASSIEQALSNIKPHGLDLGDSMSNELGMSLGSSMTSLGSSLNTSVSTSRGKDSRTKSSRNKRKLDNSQQLSSSKKSKG